MNLSQLKYFQHLARVGHQTRAAADLFITQPTLSHAIASLSDELGCELFARNGRELVLTPEGRVFLSHVDRALAEITCGIEEVNLREGKLSGTIELGSIASVRSYYLPAAIKAFRRRVGSYVSFELFQGSTEVLSKKMPEGFCDVLVVGPTMIPGTERTLLFCQELALAMRSDHVLADRRSVSLSELAGCEVVTYRRGTAVGERMTRFLDDHASSLGSIHLLRNCDDEVSMGAKVVGDDAVALTIVNSNLPVYPDLTLVPLREPGALEFYPIYAVHRTSGYLKPAVARFVEFLRDFEGPQYERPDYAAMARGVPVQPQ